MRHIAAVNVKLEKKPDTPSGMQRVPDEPEPRWTAQASRATAALAVIAAVASGYNASEFSTTILTQGRATDEWGFYQAKSIKEHIRDEQLELLTALAQNDTALGKALDALRSRDAEESARYEREKAELKATAEGIEREKGRHLKRSERFGAAFIALQAGVVVCTVTTTTRRKGLFYLAIALGVGGLAMVANAFMLWL